LREASSSAINLTKASTSFDWGAAMQNPLTGRELSFVVWALRGFSIKKQVQNKSKIMGFFMICVICWINFQKVKVVKIQEQYYTLMKILDSSYK
jgi:hypothetical protein